MSKENWQGVAVILIIALIAISVIALFAMTVRATQNGKCHELGYARAIDMGDVGYCVSVDLENKDRLIGKVRYTRPVE